jgi:hypothetical protein
MNESIRSIDQSSTSISIDALKEIVQNCQRNEQRLHELERHTRHERKKAERLLREQYRIKQERDKQVSTTLTNHIDDPKPKQQPQSIEYFVPLDDDDNNKKHRHNNKSQTKDKYLLEKSLAGDSKTTSKDAVSTKERQKESINSDKKNLSQSVRSTNEDLSIPNDTHRVRFNILENETKNNNDKQFYERLNSYVHTGRFTTVDQIKADDHDDDISKLSRRCEDLLLRLHAHRDQATILENHDYHQPRTSVTPQYDAPSSELITLQKALELLRPGFISDSRQRVQHINQLREEREHNSEIDRERQQINQLSYANPIIHHNTHRNSVQLPLTYRDMKEVSKKKYERLPEVSDRLRQGLIHEIRQRNYIRAKIFHIRLRQHVLSHGRTNIDKSLTLVET